jgi:hypothetical protein
LVAALGLMLGALALSIPGVVAAQAISVGETAAARDVIPACEEGVVKDDGTPETGYGWVPSVIEGIYVQELHVAELSSRLLETVCICWMRSRSDSSLDFDVVIYPDVDGAPAMEPAIVVPASISDVPQALDGVFAEVDMPGDGVMLGSGTFYVGARWNASADQFFFVCADRSEGTPVVDGYFTDDRADGWESVLDTQDPIFTQHRAMMIRAVAAENDGFGVPALGPWGVAGLVGALALVAVLLLRRRG